MPNSPNAYPEDPGLDIDSSAETVRGHRIDFLRENVRAPLDMYQGSSSPSSTTSEMREIIHNYSNRQGLKWCQRGPLITSPSGAAYRRACGNKWACPSCSPWLLKRDCERIAAVLRRAPGVGYLTLSIRHEPGAHAAQSLDALLATWKRAFTVGSWLTKYKDRAEMLGWLRSIEFTFTPDGAHAHSHAAFVFSHSPSSQELSSLKSRWLSAANALGFVASMRAQDVRCVPQGDGRDSIAFYLTEQNAIRQSRPGKGRTPGDLLHSIDKTGDADDLDRLLGFHQATKGRRKIAFSRGFDDLCMRKG